jgi:hypothetical protein
MFKLFFFAFEIWIGCHLKHVWKGINGLTSYNVLYSNDIMVKTSLNSQNTYQYNFLAKRILGKTKHWGEIHLSFFGQL